MPSETPLEIVTVPCRTDNYAYLLRGNDGVTLIDAPETGPIVDVLETRGWSLETILLTHHHHDHTAAVADLRGQYDCAVMGPKAEAAKLPSLTRALDPGDRLGRDETAFEVIAVPGHTLGHVAFHYERAGAVFTADSLMALGCGRVFEGTTDMMWESLMRLAALPAETMVYSGHEYTEANAAFARTIEPGNPALISRIEAITAARADGQPTAQVPLSEELATNPFLRASQSEVKRALGMLEADDADVFAEIRGRKDRF